MYMEIQIGEKTVPLLANGATPFWYKQIFGKDLIALINSSADSVETLTQAAPELAFVMAKQAECEKFEDMKNIGKDQFIEFLSGFEPLDIQMALGEIVGVYMGNTITSVTPKKKQTKK